MFVWYIKDLYPLYLMPKQGREFFVGKILLFIVIIAAGGCHDEKKNVFVAEEAYTNSATTSAGDECDAGVGYKATPTGQKTKDGKTIYRLDKIGKHATCPKGLLVSK